MADESLEPELPDPDETPEDAEASASETPEDDAAVNPEDAAAADGDGAPEDAGAEPAEEQVDVDAETARILAEIEAAAEAGQGPPIVDSGGDEPPAVEPPAPAGATEEPDAAPAAEAADVEDNGVPEGGVEGDVDEETARILADLEAQLNISDDEAEAEATQAVEAAVADMTSAASDVADLSSMPLPDFSGNAPKASPGMPGDPAGMALLHDVALDVQIELGRSRMFVEDVLRLTPDSVIELDKAAGDPVDIYVNERHVARGEVLVLNENFCVRISEIIQYDEDED